LLSALKQKYTNLRGRVTLYIGGAVVEAGGKCHKLEVEVDWQHHTSIQLCVKIPTYKCIQVCVLLVKCLSCIWKMLNMYNQCHFYLYEKLIFLIYIKKDGWKFNSSSCTWTRLEQLAPHPNYLTALRATANQLWCAVRQKIKNKQQSLPCEAYNIQKT